MNQVIDLYFVSTVAEPAVAMDLMRVQDVEKESQYGYVYGVSGPGE